MAEFCPECWDALMGTEDARKRYILSKTKELCEGCGQLAYVIEAPRYRFLLREWFQASFSRRKHE